MKAAQALVLAVAVYFSVGASDPTSRLNNLSHRLMCTCGCNELLGECNHVGCPDSPGELEVLRKHIAAGEGDGEIMSFFAAKYGATVLAAPTAHGFDLVAWIAPVAVFAAALLGTVLLVRRWANLSEGQTQTAGGTAVNGDPEDLARREKIRRETDSDGGF